MRPMSEPAASVEQRFGLGPIDQISFAVRDVDEAAVRYTAMFGGPFSVIDVPEMNVLCRGRPSTTTLKLGFGRTAGLEVELVQVVSGDWPTLSWLESHGEGLHHIRFPVPDVARTKAEMEQAGFEVTLDGTSGTISFAYLEAPLLSGMTIELISAPE
jgi:catechol 2,3-dioxygenase-like lactoylglutathione lyase family enzyme